MTTNIFKVYSQVNESDRKEGLGWYQSALSFNMSLAEKYSTTSIITSGVCAAFSPMKSWKDNQRITDLYFQGIYGHTKMQIAKAKEIEQWGTYCKTISILGGLKTQNFFRCIIDPSDKNALCLDRHMISIAYGENVYRCTDKQYREIEGVYKGVASELNIIPSTLQAQLWVGYRRIKKEKFNEKENI